MTRAQFTHEQPKVLITPISEEMTQYQICLNGEQTTITDEDTERIEYLYDYFEFREYNRYLSSEDVLNNPEAYTDYVPIDTEPDAEKPSNALREEIDALKERQELTDEAVQELILMTLGG